MAKLFDELKNRLALVTGGARGIGKGIAEELLHQGCKVVIADVRESDMDATCAQLASLGEIASVKMDVSDSASIDAAVERVRAEHGAVEVLVNNAGVGKPARFDEEDPDWIRKTLEIDLVGMVYLTRRLLPEMVARGWGRICNVSSMMGFSGSPGFVTYSAAKFGVAGFSEALERELRQYHDIKVTVVMPPSVQTQAFSEAKRDEPTLMRWQYVPPITVEQMAQRTVHGLAKGKRRVYGSSQSWLAAVAERISPRIMDVILLRMFRPAPTTTTTQPQAT